MVKRKAGQPEKLVEIDLDYVERLSASGMTMPQVAAALGVSQATIYNKMAKSQEFLEAIKRGKKVSDGKVVESLYSRAIGYSHPDTHISSYEGEITVTPIIKHYPPDTGAAFIWLKNRKSEDWKDRHDIHHSGEIKLPAIVQLPPKKPKE